MHVHTGPVIMLPKYAWDSICGMAFVHLCQAQTEAQLD